MARRREYRRTNPVVVVAVAVGAFASAKLYRAMTRHEAPAPAFEIDQARFTREVEARWSAAMDSPDAQAALTQLIAGVVADPEVAAAGSELATALGDDPTLAPGIAALVARAQQDPSMTAVVRALAAAHPGATPEQIGELAQARITAAAASPAYARAWDAAWRDFMSAPEIAAARDRLGAAAARHPALTLAFEDDLRPALDDRTIEARVIAANGGEVPDRDRATALLLDQFFPPARVARAAAQIVAMPGLRRAAAAALRDVARAPSFRASVAAELRGVLDDPDVRDRAIAALAAMSADPPREDALRDAFARVLALPSVRRAVAGLIDRMLADPALARIGGRMLGEVARDPAFGAIMRELMGAR